MNEVIIIRGTRHVVWECRGCGVLSTCPESVWDQQRAEGGYHHCSNGHQWGWSKETCEREKLRRERDRLKQDTARLNDEIADERSKRVAAEKKIASVQRRTSAGVCPCCNRTFIALARHMKSKHPNIVSLETKTG